MPVVTFFPWCSEQFMGKEAKTVCRNANRDIEFWSISMCVGCACICVSVWSSRTHFCLFKVKYCSYISPDSTDRGSDLNSAKPRVKLGWNVVILSRPLIPVRDKPFLLRVLCQCFSTQWISNHPMSTNVDFRTKGDCLTVSVWKVKYQTYMMLFE